MYKLYIKIHVKNNKDTGPHYVSHGHKMIPQCLIETPLVRKCMLGSILQVIRLTRKELNSAIRYDQPCENIPESHTIPSSNLTTSKLNYK